MKEKRYDEALTAAEQVVTLTTALFGERSAELGTPLVNLATAQVNTGNLVGAEGNYNLAVLVIEQHEGIASMNLVNPLVGLGETYMRGGFYGQANEAYSRALKLNHVNAGFYNAEQMKILDGLTESHLVLGQIDNANIHQRKQVSIEQRQAARGDATRLSAAHYKLGRWYNRTGQYLQSRESFYEGRRVARESGESIETQVEGLLGESLSYLNEGAAPISLGVLKRALELIDIQPERNPALRAEVLVSLADVYLLVNQAGNARERYVQTWNELNGTDALLAQREKYFAQPTVIAMARLPKYLRADGKKSDGRAIPGGYADGVVLASFTVTDRGDIEDATIVESNPPGALDRELLLALDYAVFRPRMVDGAVVATPGAQHRHEFKYPSSGMDPPEGAEPEDRDDPAGKTGGRIEYPEGESDGSGDKPNE